MNNTQLHTETYKSLAQEYETNAGAVKPHIAKAMARFFEYINPDSAVLDVGCGIGLGVELANQRGAKTTGIELSYEMARFAKKRNPTSQIIVGDFFDYNFKQKYDGIIFGAFLHLFSKKEVGVILQRSRQLLNNKGVVFIDTTKSEKYSAGLEPKSDYHGEQLRFRVRWTKTEFLKTLKGNRYKVNSYQELKGAKSKNWMVFVVSPI